MNRSSKYIFLVSLASIFAGIIFFLINREILIIHFDFFRKPTELSSLNQDGNTSRKKVLYYFWKEEKFRSESGLLLWEKNNAVRNIQNLLTHWMITLHDEKLIAQDVKLFSVALSASQEEAFISFNQSLLPPDSSIMKKWYLIESLLKTMREAGTSVRSIMFLTHDAPIEDNHLDFSQGWPIEGFL